MTASITRCCRKWLELALAALLFAGAVLVHAGSIEPLGAKVSPGEDGYVLSAEFKVELGPRLEEAVARGVPLYFNLEFELSRHRWYWANEHIATLVINYKLAYNALTRQYRLSFGGLHQNFETLAEALRVISRVAALPVTDKGAPIALKAGETYSAAVRLSLDRNQLPKPFQVESLANRDWQVDALALRWQFFHNDQAGK